METKANPNPNGCLARALPDEPMFILLGRDPSAPAAIRGWVDERSKLENQDSSQLAAALNDASEFEAWRIAHDGEWRNREPGDLELTPSDELSSVAGRVMGRGNPLDSRRFVANLLDGIAKANSADEAQTALKDAFGGLIDDARSLAGYVLNADPQRGPNA
jgi:hypothetical protein